MIEKEEIANIELKNNTVVRLHVENPHTYFGVPHNTSSSMEFISQINDCDYKEEIYYLNYTSLPITIVNRNGLSVTVENKISLSSRDIIIRKIIYFNNYSLKSAIAAIQNNTEVDDVELVEIKKSFSSLENANINKASVMIDYCISKDDIQKKGNTIYHYQTDLLLTYKQGPDHPQHPYSAKFINIGSFGNTKEYTNQPEFNFKLRYISHDLNPQPLYVNVFGKVYLIRPQKDSPVRSVRVRDSSGKRVNKTFESYIQVFYGSQSDPDIINPVGVAYERYPLEEARLKFGLYDTYAEAINSNSSDALRKEELSKLSHALEVTKHRNAVDKLELENKLESIKNENSIKRQELDKEALALKSKQTILDTELLSLDNQKRILEMSKRQVDETLDRETKLFDDTLKKLRAEHDEVLKQETMRIKEMYESRQHARKDAIDFVKFIPATIIGIGAIAALVIKLKEAKQ